jgi:hypothetical protein
MHARNLNRFALLITLFVAVASNATLYAQSIRLVERWTYRGDAVESDIIGSPGNIVFDRNGGVLFLDRQAGVIRRFDREGNRLPNIGRIGAGPGEFGRGSHQLAFNPSLDTLFTLDYPNGRIVWYTGAGYDRHGSIPISGNHLRPQISHRIQVLRESFLITGAAVDNQIVHRYSRSGVLLDSAIELIDYKSGIGGNYPSPGLKLQFNRGQVVPFPGGYWFVLNTPYTLVRMVNGRENLRMTDSFIEPPWERYVRTTQDRYEVDHYPGTWLAGPVGADRFMVMVARPRQPSILDVRSLADGRLLSRTVISYEGYQIEGFDCAVLTNCFIGIYNHKDGIFKTLQITQLSSTVDG